MTTTTTFTIATTIQQHLQDLTTASPLVTACLGAVIGSTMTLLATFFLLHKYGLLESQSPVTRYHQDQRRRLPQTIIVIRHGESEANVDHSLWKTIPDNLLGLTPKGRLQATAAGQRVERILTHAKAQRVHLVISPFERTLQTAHYIRRAFEPLIVRTDIEPRLREQEVGNLQGEDFSKYREEQKRVGRFWYRFPTGESGSDVLDRVKSWWFENVLTVNLRVGYEPVDAMIIVTHGLTLRFLLMQLFGWSPTTFHSVWNANNCDMYVLQKDLNKPGNSPYVLSEELGDMPRSSIDVRVKLKNGTKLMLTLEDYLGIPPPRTTRTKLVKLLLAEQYPDQIYSANDIKDILFMPFIEGGVVRGRSTSGVGSTPKSSSSRLDSSTSSDTSSDSEQQVVDETDDMDESNTEEQPNFRVARNLESSFRYPCCKIPGLTE